MNRQTTVVDIIIFDGSRQTNNEYENNVKLTYYTEWKPKVQPHKVYDLKSINGSLTTFVYEYIECISHWLLCYKMLDATIQHNKIETVTRKVSFSVNKTTTTCEY